MISITTPCDEVWVEKDGYWKIGDVSCVHYVESDMLKDDGGNNPRKAFRVVYNGYDLPFDGFVDFVTPKIICDLIDEFIEEDDNL